MKSKTKTCRQTKKKRFITFPYRRMMPFSPSLAMIFFTIGRDVP